MVKSQLPRLALCVTLIIAPTVLTACGGGGSGGSPAPIAVSPPPPPPLLPPPPPPPSGLTWQSGVFAASSSIKDRCEVVRTGVDSEGRSFPDIAGSLLSEKFWLRSWTNETYLWNNEVLDTDPAATPSKLDYFAKLRTVAKTSSNRDKDNFHFSQSTAEYLASRNSTPEASFGVSFVFFSSTRPRDIRVRYTEPNSPAAQVVGGQAKLVRGSKILSVNGVDAVNGGTTQADLDTLNNGLFPPLAGTTTTLVVRDPGATADRTVTLVSANLAPKPVNRTQIIATPTGNVGYILFNTFSPFASEREIRDAMDTMKTANVADLILDLRYNGGGLLNVAGQLGYMVAGPTATAGKFFESLKFNSLSGNFNPVTGAVNTPTAFASTGLGFSVPNGTPLPTLNLRRVYVLSTARTCSASEAVINGLRGIDVEVILIGGTTCGKPYGFYATSNCSETYYTIQFQGLNSKGFGDYADGFVAANSTAPFGVRVPGCSVSDDFTKELGDAQESMLATALSYRASGTCPTPPSSEAGTSNATAVSETDRGLSEPRPSIFEVNRDMTMPR
jgi:carboxyl-terminal processing protease